MHKSEDFVMGNDPRSVWIQLIQLIARAFDASDYRFRTACEDANFAGLEAATMGSTRLRTSSPTYHHVATLDTEQILVEIWSTEMRFGAQTRKQTGIRYALELMFANVLKGEEVSSRSIAAVREGCSYQHHRPEIKVLHQLRDEDVGSSQTLFVLLLHLSQDIYEPFELGVGSGYPCEVDLKRIEGVSSDRAGWNCHRGIPDGK